VLTLAMYRLLVNADQQNEIAASVAAHGDLGPGYDEAVAQGLVERIGEEIDKRVDARLGHLGSNPVPPRQPSQHQVPAYQAVPPGYQAPAPTPASAPPAHRGATVTGMILGLGSMGLGVGATAVATSHAGNAAAQVLIILLIWAAIAIINIAYARRR
jgi:hypothetical protein